MKADGSTSDVEIRRLTDRDLDQIEALYASVFRRTAHGFLARRERSDFARVFQSPNVSVGAFEAGALVGYQLHNEIPELRFDEGRFRNTAAIVHSRRVLFGKGTVIALDHQGSGIAPRISSMVADLAANEGFRFRMGQVHIANLSSIKYVLAGGRTFVGLSTDEFGLNFISCGFFGRSLVSARTASCPVDDVEAAATALERYHAVSLDGVTGRPALEFASVKYVDND